MATNWVIPTGNDVRKVLSLLVEQKSNEPTSADSKPGDVVDPSIANRRNDLVTLYVQELRGLIQSTGRSPLSVTLGAVPPEANLHVLYKAAWALTVSVPSLQMAIVTDKGISAPFAKFYEAACDYFKKVGEGRSITAPTDPTGKDYLTAASAENPLPSGVAWGDLNATGADYEAGYVTTQTGVVRPLPLDEMTSW